MANAIKKKDETNVVAFDPSMFEQDANKGFCLLYTSPSPRDRG